MDLLRKLNDLFSPTHYDLSIKLNRKERSFSGIVAITGVVRTQEKPLIGLHSKGLEINSVQIDGKAADWSVQTNDELIIEQPGLATGKHIVVVSYSGKITDDMNGIYPSYYNVRGEKAELLATQFESHYARQAFPCVDEPAAKATFDITLTTDTDQNVLSNMPLKYQRIENGLLVSQFETTPKMSTYLVAWVAGNLHKKTALTKRGVEVSVWATPAQKPASLDFALEIATKCIDFFEEYFGVDYPLPKSDHVALPDFSAGAMENWGLITYREIALLADPSTATLAAKQQAALTIAHELSHQWFGNLVTMKWWNDLWLNESFANMMEYLAIDAIHPEWEVWLDQATNESLSALSRDCLDGVQAIQTEVNHPDEISTLFDPSIVYAKGGRLLKMLQNFIGEESFQKGLNSYFLAHAYSNTEADDLWTSLTKASGQDIKSIMNAWITNPGYPVVNVSLKGNQIHLNQERFFVGPKSTSTTVWPIPLDASTTQLPKLFSEKEISCTLNDEDSLTYLNKSASSHFITLYDENIFNVILKDLPKLPTVFRLNFMFEQVLLARAGKQSMAALIPLLEKYSQEESDAVWDTVSIAINELKRLTEGNEIAETQLKELVGRITSYNYERLGWVDIVGEPESDKKLRSTIVSLALYANNPDAIKTSKLEYDSKDILELPNELRLPILAQAVKSDTTSETVDNLLAMYKTEANSEIRDDLAAAITSTKNPDVIKMLVALLKDTSLIRPQDFTYWLVWLIRNRFGREITWQWVRNEWAWIHKTFQGDSHYDAFPRYIASSLVNNQQLSEYREFFENKKEELALARNIEVGITELTGRVELIERESPLVAAKLSEFSSK